MATHTHTQRDWDSLAKEQLEKIFSAQSDAMDADLRRLVDNVYTMDGIEHVSNNCKCTGQHNAVSALFERGRGHIALSQSNR